MEHVMCQPRLRPSASAPAVVVNRTGVAWLIFPQRAPVVNEPFSWALGNLMPAVVIAALPELPYELQSLTRFKSSRPARREIQSHDRRVLGSVKWRVEVPLQDAQACVGAGVRSRGLAGESRGRAGR
jgi:hypothetical protein